jgi:hypothetical protein
VTAGNNHNGTGHEVAGTSEQSAEVGSGQIGNSKSDSEKHVAEEGDKVPQPAIVDGQGPSEIHVPEEDLATTKPKLQPFEACRKRELWDQKYGHLQKTNIEEEKLKIETNMKPPRKPLSPYLFFSQERRKVIK